MAEVKGRDCPQCNQPDMFYRGIRKTPLVVENNDIVTSIEVGIYECLNCHALEWVAKSE